ncbi:MAG: hypothetical protein RLZZ597_2535 [Cyanobacteriota bacterium]|jgi:hypothetical protein
MKTSLWFIQSRATGSIIRLGVKPYPSPGWEERGSGR